MKGADGIESGVARMKFGVGDEISNIGVEVGDGVSRGYKGVVKATVIERLEEAGAEFVGKMDGELEEGVDFALRSEDVEWGVSLKPTYGAVSRYGVMARASSMDAVRCVARKAEVMEAVLVAMAGCDERDAMSEDGLLGMDSRSVTKVGVIEGLRSGGVEEFVKKLKTARYETEGVKLEMIKYILAVHTIVGAGELASSMMRYDGVRYGYRDEKAQDLMGMYEGSRGEVMSAEEKARVILGVWVSSKENYEDYYLKAQKVRAVIKREVEKVFGEVDVLVGNRAIGEMAELLGLPMVIIGDVKLVGRRWEDLRVLDVAKKVEGAE